MHDYITSRTPSTQHI